VESSTLTRGTRSSVMGQDHLWLLTPQTSAAWPRTSPDVQFSLEIRILDLGAFRWTKANRGQNGGQTDSQTKRRDLLRASLCIAMAALCRRRLPGWHSAEEVVAAVAPTMATSQPSVGSHCQLGPAGYGPTTIGRPVPRVVASIEVPLAGALASDQPLAVKRGIG